MDLRPHSGATKRVKDVLGPEQLRSTRGYCLRSPFGLLVCTPEA